ncbi:MAG: hypothetical protein JXQ65_07830 [Candidatus Marinimicrobia bacterium]|nr:hypothetical protein [Candidatus Neomarinimicrobiota bacterium]
MSDVSSITSSNYIGQSQFTTSARNVMGQDEFLKLLTVQLQNQDPLSPLDSQDFSSQIAQFSQVEQLEQMSNSMTQSNEIDLMLTQAITNTMSTTLVGKRAKVSGNQVMLNKDGDAAVTFKLANAASSVKITVRDEQGQIVKTIDKNGFVDGIHTVDWDGKDKNGNQLSKDKKYTFEVEAVSPEGNAVAAELFMIGIIQGVQYADNTTLLILNTGQKTAFSSVLEIMAPEDLNS